MREEEDIRLDQLFKKRLSDTDNSFVFNEEDWDKLELLLTQKEKKHRYLIWIRICATTAAMVLLFVGWWVFKVETPALNETIKLTKELKKAADQPKEIEHYTNGINDKLNSWSLPVPALAIRVAKAPENSRINFDNTISLNLQSDSSIATNTQRIVVIDSVIKLTPQPLIALNQSPKKDVEEGLSTPNNEQPNMHKNDKKHIPLLAVGVFASSDINGVNSLKKNKVGTTYGVILSVPLTKRLTLQTGVSYALKPYEIEYSYANSYAYKVNPLSATARCEMLDVPLNLDFTFLDQPKNKMNIGAGFSSYIMLNESYKYNYGPNAKVKATSYTISDSKSYLWSMLNLTATYQRKLNPYLGIIVQPYLKVPIKEVGYSNIKLHTAGVSLGLQMNVSRNK